MESIHQKTLSELVRQLQAGYNDQIFNELYRRLDKYACRAARANVRTDADAEDVAQAALTNVLMSINSLQDPDKILVWLKVAVSRQAKDFMQKASTRYDVNFSGLSSEDEEGEEEDFNPADENMNYQPEAQMDLASVRSILYEILDSLPDKQRLVVDRFYFNNETAASIAEDLGCSVNTVKSQLKYAKAKIKDKVEEIQKKDGIKLYSVSPFAVLVWLYRTAENEEVRNIPGSESLLNALNASYQHPYEIPEVPSHPGGSSGSRITGTHAGSAAGVKAAASAFMGTAAGKITAGVIAVAVIAGVPAAAGGAQNTQPSPSAAEETVSSEPYAEIKSQPSASAAPEKQSDDFNIDSDIVADSASDKKEAGSVPSRQYSESEDRALAGPEREQIEASQDDVNAALQQPAATPLSTPAPATQNAPVIATTDKITAAQEAEANAEAQAEAAAQLQQQADAAAQSQSEDAQQLQNAAAAQAEAAAQAQADADAKAAEAAKAAEEEAQSSADQYEEVPGDGFGGFVISTPTPEN